MSVQEGSKTKASTAEKISKIQEDLGITPGDGPVTKNLGTYSNMFNQRELAKLDIEHAKMQASRLYQHHIVEPYHIVSNLLYGFSFSSVLCQVSHDMVGFRLTMTISSNRFQDSRPRPIRIQLIFHGCCGFPRTVLRRA